MVGVKEDVLESVRPKHDVKGMESALQNVLVWAGVALI